MSNTEPILEVRSLKKYFPIRNVFSRRVGWLKAVDDVSFKVRPGEIMGLVGESGCGKTTLGKTIIGINPPTSGQIMFESEDIGRLPRREHRRFSGNLQYVYQDPGASLDPRWKIRRSLHEPLIIHTDLTRQQRDEQVRQILRAVGLPHAHLDLYPHELSGGQQRRVGLARILTLQPRMVILDEPTSGLDVSVQATILKLFRSLQQTFDLTYLFISHDLSVVRMMCHRVAVMYLGRIMEVGQTKDIFENPRHPYTRSLLSAIPQIGGERLSDDVLLEGEPPDAGNLPSGCRFLTRCPLAEEVCVRDDPQLRTLADGHAVACHLV